MNRKDKEVCAQETHHCDLHLYRQSECYKLQSKLKPPNKEFSVLKPQKFWSLYKLSAQVSILISTIYSKRNCYALRQWASSVRQLYSRFTMHYGYNILSYSGNILCPLGILTTLQNGCTPNSVLNNEQNVATGRERQRAWHGKREMKSEFVYK